MSKAGMTTTSDTDDRKYRLPPMWEESVPHDVTAWRSRRAELLDAFSRYVYGRTPVGGGVRDVVQLSGDETALAGVATRAEYRVRLRGPNGGCEIHILVHRPNHVPLENPVPVFVGLNFGGNHATTPADQVRISTATNSASRRGAESRRWPFELITARGYAVATLHRDEIDPDEVGRRHLGVRGIFPNRSHTRSDWGAIGGWAWGLSRALDVLRHLPGLDASAAVVVGHSRLGKAALWAAAQDERFAAAISNDSGCAGAALFRGKMGEDVAAITRRFPHWFAGQLDDFQGAEDALPVDQHMLLALIAPRPLHVASATNDAWADPRSEFLSTLHATPIFTMLGGKGTITDPFDDVLRESLAAGDDLSAEVARHLATPPPGRRIGGRLSYHLRAGDHDLLAEDWEHFLDFADAELSRSPGASAPVGSES